MLGTVLMVVAGVAWAVPIAGRGAADLLAANARSFLLVTPLALALSLVARPRPAPARRARRASTLAAVSGAVTSGLGYAIWYGALRGLTVLQAAIVQLAVPIIAAGAVTFLHERPTARLAQAGALVLGGLALALTAPRRRA